SGLNDNGNTTTVRVCGDVTINGYLNIKGDLQITEGSTLTVDGINFNGNNASMTVYPDAVLTIRNQHGSGGDIVNHGTIIFNQGYNINSNGSMENNGVVTVGSNFNNNESLINNGSFTVSG